MNIPCAVTALFLLACLLSSFTFAKETFRKDAKLCTDKNRVRADGMLKELVALGNDTRKFPENYKELKKFCDDSTTIISFLHDFLDKCYTGMVRDVGKIFMYSGRGAIKSLCKGKKTKKITQLLAVMPCVNNHVKDTKCYFDVMDRMANIQFIDNDKLKIPHTCCEYNKGMQCIESLMHTLPCSDHTQTIVDFVNTVTGNAANFACGDYTEDSDKCNSLGELPTTKRKNKVKYQSFLFLLIDMFESIKE